MSLGGILLSGLGLQERERQRDRETETEEEERRRRRRHRSHRHAGDGWYPASRIQGRRRDDAGDHAVRRRSYVEDTSLDRRDPEYPPRGKPAVAARGPRDVRDVTSQTAPATTDLGGRDRRRSGRAVSMRRASSTSSREGSDVGDTPPTTPGDTSHAWSPPKPDVPQQGARQTVQMRGGPQRRETESSTEDDYTRLTPGKRRLRTGETADGARGTDFMVGVRSDIGSVSTGSDSESEPEASTKCTHLKIITRPCAADKMMTGALPPGTEPHRTTGPPISRPLISRTSSKQSDGFLSQLLRPSPHHANVKRSSTSSSRRRPRTTIRTSSSSQAGSKRSVNAPEAPPAVMQRRATAPAVPTVPEDPTPAEPEPTVECLTCCDDVPESQAAKLECDHIMCMSCLKRIFELSVTDPAHMPPKCCTKKNIPLQYVAPMFDNKFKVLWNKKFQEFSTKDRMYCPKKGCGEWIQPVDQKMDKSVGRRYGICGKCKTKVCKKCNTKWHGSKECQNDKETEQLLNTAKKEGWQRCYSCKAMVQLAEGCNHMKCRCTAEFCMICGSKWKTCDCPWFNTPPENNPIFFPPPDIFRPRFRMRPGLNGGPPRPVLEPGIRHGLGGFAAEIAARRAQEQADEELARRLQLGDMPPDPDAFPHQHHPVPGLGGHEFGLGAPGVAGIGAGAFGLLAQIARLAIDNMNENADNESYRRRVRVGRNSATVQAGWTRPRRRATVSERSRARAPDPPRPFVEVYEDPDTQSDDDNNSDAGSDVDEFESARRRREARRRRQSSSAGPSAATMAGLGGRRVRGARDRVGGWLDHVSGGDGTNAHRYEV